MYPRLATSESVAEGHPDKIADRISDAVLDAVLAQDPEGRVACETFVLQGMVLIGGEMATTASIQPERIARRVIREIGYIQPDYGLSHETCAVLNAMRQQSPDIAQAVLRSQERKGGSTDPYDTLGAGDQGIMFGYATTETPEYMPLPITLAHKLAKRLAQVRKDGTLPYLRPDGKTQVTIEYRERKPTRAHTILIAAQHAPEVELERLAEDIRKYVVEPVADGWLDENTEILVNTSGRFVVGGPAADTGMTGRKIIVDTYGGYGSHGGGAFSGKDPTKVDRSGSYMARYVALNIVAAGLAQECEVQIAYAIGRARPLAVNVDCYGTGILPNGILREVVLKVFDFRPAAIIEKLDLRRPIYEPFSCYGHFGRLELDPPWERPDMVEALKREAAKHTRKVV